MTSARARAWPVLLLLPLVAVTAWVAARARTVREDPAAVLLALRAAQGPDLPDASAVGAGSRAALERFNRDTLYEYIDGAADAFLARGFQRCAVANYTFAGAAGAAVELAAEAHRFATPEGARAQMEAERPGAARPLPEVPGALADGTVLVLVAGNDLLKLTVLQGGPEAAKSLRQVAAAWQKEQPR